MKELIFATSNNGKAASLQKLFDSEGVAVRVVARSLDIHEIQADTALEVARAKALDAHRKLGGQLVVDDSELRIIALNGFPGPYQKAMTEKLGPEGYVHLLDGYDDRRAYFISNLVFVDNDGALHEFSDDPYWGEIATTVDSSEREAAWGPLWKVFIPKGLSVTLSQLSDTEKRSYGASRQDIDAYKKFTEWYKQHYA